MPVHTLGPRSSKDIQAEGDLDSTKISIFREQVAL